MTSAMGPGPNGDPTLEAVKTWTDGDERQRDTVTLAEYGTFEATSVVEA